ncbi:MAG TPA: chromosomal replication initiator protein DnaA [Anaerohalosphaeraceae bacterium]|nr:chromosomal replication initiator protein DnaA [Anaerohalosphaeraceae bacterium]
MEAIFTDEVHAIQEHIAKEIGAQQYQIWFRNAARLDLREDCLEIAVANTFISQWIQGHFEKPIQKALQVVLGQSRSVRYATDPSLRPAARSNGSVNHSASARRQNGPAPDEPAGRRIQPLKLKLDSFIVGAKNELAFNAAKTVVQQEKSPFNPLFYHGGYGVGKTHLLQGICNEIAFLRPQSRWLYVSAEDFANQYVLALKTRKLDAFRRRFRGLDLLAIDDIHFLSSKNAMQEEFLHTFNSIDLAGKQIVLASDAHPKEIGALCKKLVNRFVSGMVVRIDPPDFDTRCRILLRRAEAMGHTVRQDVVEYIAGAISSNVRELEGALLKLAAYSSLVGGKMTLAAAQEALSEHIARTDPVVHSSDITACIAEFFQIKPADIYSARKERTVSLARSMAMYLTRRFTKMSFPEIGKAMGNKNHATVILACRKVEEALQRNSQLRWRSPEGFRCVPAKEVLDRLIEKIS